MPDAGSMVSKMVYLPQRVARDLERLARTEERSESQVIRQAVVAFIAHRQRGPR